MQPPHALLAVAARRPETDDRPRRGERQLLPFPREARRRSQSEAVLAHDTAGGLRRLGSGEAIERWLLRGRDLQPARWRSGALGGRPRFRTAGRATTAPAERDPSVGAHTRCKLCALSRAGEGRETPSPIVPSRAERALRRPMSGNRETNGIPLAPSRDVSAGVGKGPV